ncbi:MAG: hypothetical protein KKD28_03565 [Chloroflexi bacterium]|nr:hypothetical protein [Chloroflexota bacterium]MBU1660533.1 hypothetical protein [Chloroflexota bacterium]
MYYTPKLDALAQGGQFPVQGREIAQILGDSKSEQGVNGIMEQAIYYEEQTDEY